MQPRPQVHTLSRRSAKLGTVSVTPTLSTGSSRGAFPASEVRVTALNVKVFLNSVALTCYRLSPPARLHVFIVFYPSESSCRRGHDWVQNPETSLQEESNISISSFWKILTKPITKPNSLYTPLFVQMIIVSSLIPLRLKKKESDL